MEHEEEDEDSLIVREVESLISRSREGRERLGRSPCPVAPTIPSPVEPQAASIEEAQLTSSSAAAISGSTDYVTGGTKNHGAQDQGLSQLMRKPPLMQHTSGSGHLILDYNPITRTLSYVTAIATEEDHGQAAALEMEMDEGSAISNELESEKHVDESVEKGEKSVLSAEDIAADGFSQGGPAHDKPDLRPVDHHFTEAGSILYQPHPGRISLRELPGNNILKAADRARISCRFLGRCGGYADMAHPLHFHHAKALPDTAIECSEPQPQPELRRVQGRERSKATLEGPALQHSLEAFDGHQAPLLCQDNPHLIYTKHYPYLSDGIGPLKASCQRWPGTEQGQDEGERLLHRGLSNSFSHKNAEDVMPQGEAEDPSLGWVGGHDESWSDDWGHGKLGTSTGAALEGGCRSMVRSEMQEYESDWEEME